jgi:hypothetical protein
MSTEADIARAIPDLLGFGFGFLTVVVLPEQWSLS